jgi:hypothetical protein
MPCVIKKTDSKLIPYHNLKNRPHCPYWFCTVVPVDRYPWGSSSFMKEKFDIIMSCESVDGLWLWYTHQACLHVRLCSRFQDSSNAPALPGIRDQSFGTEPNSQQTLLRPWQTFETPHMYGFHYFTSITHNSLCVWPQPFSCKIFNIQENVHCFREQPYQLCIMMTLSWFFHDIRAGKGQGEVVVVLPLELLQT